MNRSTSENNLSISRLKSSSSTVICSNQPSSPLARSSSSDSRASSVSSSPEVSAVSIFKRSVQAEDLSCPKITLNSIPEGAVFNVPNNVTSLEVEGSVRGKIVFDHDETQCANFYAKELYVAFDPADTIEIFEVGRLYVDLEFGEESACEGLYIKNVKKAATIAIPSSASYVEIGEYSGQLKLVIDPLVKNISITSGEIAPITDNLYEIPKRHLYIHIKKVDYGNPYQITKPEL